MLTQAPRQLTTAVAGLLPLSPEIKIVRITCLQAISQDLEGGAAATALLHVAVGDLTGELVEVVRQVGRAEACHPHINATPVLPRGQPLALEHPCPALPHPVPDVLGQLERDRSIPTDEGMHMQMPAVPAV